MKKLINIDEIKRNNPDMDDELESVINKLDGVPYYEMFTSRKIKSLERLNERHPNMKEVASYLKSIIGLLPLKKDKRISFPPILLVGNPGCGKTEWATKFSNIMCGRNMRMDCTNGLTDFQLAGTQRSFRKSSVGMIVKSMFSDGKGPLMNPIFIFDELEKVKSNDYSMENTLLSLLEKSSSKKFIDNYIGTTIDCSGILYIACCNSLDGIPDPVLNRFKVFKIPDYTHEEIVFKVIPSIYKAWISDENIREDRVPKELCRDFCEQIALLAKDNVRNIKHAFFDMFNYTCRDLDGVTVAFFSEEQLKNYTEHAGVLKETEQ